MRPILFELFGYEVNSFGFMVALGFCAGYVCLNALAGRAKISPVTVVNVYLGMLLSSLLGARALYVLIHWDQFSDDLLAVFAIWQGGVVVYGGILASLLFSYLYARRASIPYGRLGDILFPCAMLGIFIGRWGCLLVGDCYGRVASESLPWAVCYPFHEKSLIPIELLNTPLHPSPIYQSLNALGLFLLSLWLLNKRRFEGEVFIKGMALYAVTRTLLETFRGDYEERVIYGWFSTSQWISLGLLVALFLAYLKMRTANEIKIEPENRLD